MFALSGVKNMWPEIRKKLLLYCICIHTVQILIKFNHREVLSMWRACVFRSQNVNWACVGTVQAAGYNLIRRLFWLGVVQALTSMFPSFLLSLDGLRPAMKFISKLVYGIGIEWEWDQVFYWPLVFLLATVYGNGVYFALQASYSAQSTYSPPDANGCRYMYLTRVLVGEYTVGRRGLLTPPAKNASDPTDIYDSVVDQMPNPGIFVVFYDWQCYPEYLITFQ